MVCCVLCFRFDGCDMYLVGCGTWMLGWIVVLLMFDCWFCVFGGLSLFWFVCLCVLMGLLVIDW